MEGKHIDEESVLEIFDRLVNTGTVLYDEGHEVVEYDDNGFIVSVDYISDLYYSCSQF
jgi:hypothetical protein